MGKFNVGDKVRRTNYRFGKLNVGDERVIHSFGGGGMKFAGDTYVYDFANFETVPALQFKVGDRVTGEWYGENRIEGTVVRVDESDKSLTCRVKADHDHELYWLKTLTIVAAEPALAAPAPFKIEVGKTYRTRDGRKIGPMLEHLPDRLIAKSGDGNIWLLDGKAGSDNINKSDLVEEWNGLTVPTAAATPKFKVGDRVRFTDRCLARWFFGPGKQVKEGVIDSAVAPSAYKYVVRTSVGTAYIRDEHAELVTEPAALPAPSKAIVALIENGQPKPSLQPHVHATEASAITEAARLAGVHKGQQFGVFVLANTQLEPKPVYDHEWQRQAANGNKIPAIKSLRHITGLTLKGAKEAVEGWLASEAA